MKSEECPKIHITSFILTQYLVCIVDMILSVGFMLWNFFSFLLTSFFFISSLRFSPWSIVRLEFKQSFGLTTVANSTSGDNPCHSLCQYLAQTSALKNKVFSKSLGQNYAPDIFCKSKEEPIKNNFQYC